MSGGMVEWIEDMFRDIVGKCGGFYSAETEIQEYAQRIAAKARNTKPPSEDEMEGAALVMWRWYQENKSTLHNPDFFEALLSVGLEALPPTVSDYEVVLADHRRLVRELDIALHGAEGAAEQASLCDLIEPARRLRVASLQSTSTNKAVEA